MKSCKHFKFVCGLGFQIHFCPAKKLSCKTRVHCFWHGWWPGEVSPEIPKNNYAKIQTHSFSVGYEANTLHTYLFVVHVLVSGFLNCIYLRVSHIRRYCAVWQSFLLHSLTSLCCICCCVHDAWITGVIYWVILNIPSDVTSECASTLHKIQTPSTHLCEPLQCSARTPTRMWKSSCRPRISTLLTSPRRIPLVTPGNGANWDGGEESLAPNPELQSPLKRN